MNVNIKNEKGLTLLGLTIQKNGQNMAQFLKENRAKTSLEIEAQ
ncbi:hypothetical protein [Wolbachia endosymbiont of Wuchereria bancrofti]|nr:hypothetical protein [Wolbachia endosymbiont of Wuchereria bancrofti]